MTLGVDANSAREHWSSRFNGLRSRMALVLLALLDIPTAYAVIHAIDQYGDRSEEQRRERQRTARLIADARASTLSSLQNWLEQNARLEAPPTRDARCNEHLATEREQSDLVTQLTLAEIEGGIVCSANLDLIGLDVGDSYWFQRTARGNPFTISELLGQEPGAALSGRRRTGLHRGLARGALVAGGRLERHARPPGVLGQPGEHAVPYGHRHLSGRPNGQAGTGDPVQRQRRQCLGDRCAAHVRKARSGGEPLGFLAGTKLPAARSVLPFSN